MTLDKAIEYGKEHRKQYYCSKAVDKSCRNHGDCDWCKGNRLHNSKKRIASIDDKMNDLMYENDEL